MPSFEVAHIREQGQDMIIFPLNDSFAYKSNSEQDRMLSILEERAHGAGLAGHAVAIWQHGNHSHFRGPSRWRDFLRSISLDWVLANVNRELSW